MTKAKLKPLTGPYIPLMVEKGIRGGVYQSGLRYMKANNKYMRNSNENEDLLCLIHFKKQNSFGWALP